MIQFPVDPVAVYIGSFQIRWYSIFMALAVLWLIFWSWLQIRKGAKLTNDNMLTMAIVGIPSGIVFARLLHVFDDIVIQAQAGQTSAYISNPASIVGGSGLTIWGAILGAALGIWIYCKITRKQTGYLFDVLAPGIIIAQAIGRVGCLLNGCCYGTPTSLPWAFLYTNPNSLAFGIPPSHPTVIYEILFDILLFFILLRLRGKLKPDGALFIVYLSLYSAWRIGDDFLRTGTPFLLGLHEAQFIGLLIVLISIPWIIIKMRPADKVKPAALTNDILS
ncbi:MAG TPA: prolipoprotein diacylglyceryl transferase [Dehalococcoidales bacterium]|nr:prolipoprotein diacylglyceryl transferase [Dehalococcoidales bacterium]